MLLEATAVWHAVSIAGLFADLLARHLPALLILVVARGKLVIRVAREVAVVVEATFVVASHNSATERLAPGIAVRFDGHFDTIPLGVSSFFRVPAVPELVGAIVPGAVFVAPGIFAISIRDHHPFTAVGLAPGVTVFVAPIAFTG